MKKGQMFFSLLIVAFTLWGCKAQYAVTNVERSRILIDKRYDANHDAELQAFITPYKQRVDSLTAPLLGRITPISYNEGTKVLKGEITNGTPQNYKRFTVTPKDLGGGATQQWYVGSDGCLTTASP